MKQMIKPGEIRDVIFINKVGKVSRREMVAEEIEVEGGKGIFLVDKKRNQAWSVSEIIKNK